MCGNALNTKGMETLSRINELKYRKNLKVDMAAVFGEKIKGLPKEFQKILLDDMATAFENRLEVFAKVQEKEHLL